MLFDFRLSWNDSLQHECFVLSCLPVNSNWEWPVFFRFLNSQLDANEKLMFDKQHISKFNFDFTRNALLFVFGSETKRNIINKRYLYVTVIILFMKVNDAICVLRSPAAHEMRGKNAKAIEWFGSIDLNRCRPFDDLHLYRGISKSKEKP